jgi:hypothetical protein
MNNYKRNKEQAMSNITYKVAHINKQGQDMIIIPVSSEVSCMSNTKKNELKCSLQAFANDAGLAGEVCLVWNRGQHFHFLAPQPWHGFFSSVNMQFITGNINRELTCSS